MAKKKRNKKGLSKSFRKVSPKRGAKVLTFKGRSIALKDPYQIPYSLLYYHIHKFRGNINKETGKPHLPEAQAMVLILKLYRNDGGKRKLISLVTPPDMIINVPNVRKFIYDNVNNLEDIVEEKFQGRYEDQLNLDKITEYTIKFIY